MVVGDGEGLAGRQAGRQTTLEEVRAEDGHPGGGRLTESRVEKEGALLVKGIVLPKIKIC